MGILSRLDSALPELWDDLATAALELKETMQEKDWAFVEDCIQRAQFTHEQLSQESARRLHDLEHVGSSTPIVLSFAYGGFD
jgi:hypothetical protein